VAILLFEYHKYYGRELQLSSSTPRLSAKQFDDLTSSFIITGGTWQLYSDNDYQGESVTYREGIYGISYLESLQGLQPAKQNVTQLVFEQSTHPGPCNLQWLRGKSIDRKVLGLNPMPCSWFQNVDSSSLSLNIGKMN